MRTYLLFGTILVALSTSAQAERALRADSTRVIDEVLVTATQTPRSIKNLPVITQVITQQDIARINPRSPLDILEMSLPGLQTSVHGGQVRLSVQGLSSEYMLILLDGERISSEGSGTIDLHRIDMALIERVEIIRGSASAIYGSNAIGGVINFITRRAKQPLELSAQAEYGTEGLQRYTASVGLQGWGIRSLTSANRNLQKEYTISNSSVSNAKMPSNESWNIGQKLQYTSPNKHWDIRLSGNYSERLQSFDSRTSYEYRVYTLSGQAAHILSEKQSLNLGYNYERYNRSTLFIQRDDLPKQPLFHLDTHTARLQYNYGQDGQDGLHLHLGAELLHEGLKGERLLSLDTRYRAHTISLYAQADWRIKDRITLSAGLREDIHSSYKGHLTPRLALLYRANNNCRIRLSYSEGFRSPTLKNTYMYWDHLGMFDIIGNTALRPERSRMISLAPEYHSKHFSLTIIGSYNHISDKIDLMSTKNSAGRLQMLYNNLEGATELWTLQSNLRWLIRPGLRLHLDHAWVHNSYMVTTDEGERVAGTSLRPHNLTAALSYEKAMSRTLNLSASASYRYSSGVRVAQLNTMTNTHSSTYLEPYGTLRIGFSALYKRSLSLKLGIDNLLNYEPRDVSFTGSLSPGRTFFASLGYTL